MENALDRAIAALDGVTALASAIDVGQSVVSNWRMRGGKVSADKCPSIERATRAAAAAKGDPSLVVTCEELRPDVAWGVLREQAA